MEFGSKFVFNYSDSEEECVSDEEYDEGFNRETHAPPAAPPPPPPPRLGALPELPASSVAPKSALMPAMQAIPLPLEPLRGSIQSDSAVHYFNDLRSKPCEPACEDAVPVSPHGQPVLASKRKSSKKHHWMEEARSRGPRGNVRGSLGGRKWRRADTNVLAVKFDKLTAPGHMHTGDPTHCSGCNVLLSQISKLDTADEDTVWSCEFCGERNLVDIVAEEVPNEADVTYMLWPAPTTTASGRSGTDDSLVVFCVDTSGSMCVTTELHGKVRLRGDRLQSLQSLNTERENQYLPGQKRNVTYVSRLQGVQAAVDHNLGEMAEHHPNRRAALVAFNSEVKVLGDGSNECVTYAGDKLRSFEEMKAAGEGTTLPKVVSSARSILSNKLYDLEEGGQTALGPALVLSVAMAAQVPGSKVIICTDGMANIGLGSLDKLETDDELTEASSFYTQVATLANDAGVSVSTITIQGTDCKLLELGRVADCTGGQVNIVDSIKLLQEFGSILADPIIATKVVAKLTLHQGLYIRDEDDKRSSVTREVGNVTKDTEITFEYGVRHSQKRSHESAGESSGTSAAKTAISELKELPFQLQITYTDLDGATAMRVLTQTRPVTSDRTEAESEINIPVVGVHAAQSTARHALDGGYSRARMNNFMHQRLMYRNVRESQMDVYDDCLGMAENMDQALNRQQQSERSTRGGTTWSDEEDSDDEEEVNETASPSGGLFGRLFGKGKKAKTNVQRRKATSDDMANIMYCQKNVSSSKAFKK